MSLTWKCTICGLVDGADAPPVHCPECGARKEMFEPSHEAPHGVAHNPMQPHDPQLGEVLGPGSQGCITDD